MDVVDEQGVYWNTMRGLYWCDKMILGGMLKSVCKYLDSRSEMAGLNGIGLS